MDVFIVLLNLKIQNRHKTTLSQYINGYSLIINNSCSIVQSLATRI